MDNKRLHQGLQNPALEWYVRLVCCIESLSYAATDLTSSVSVYLTATVT